MKPTLFIITTSLLAIGITNAEGDKKTEGQKGRPYGSGWMSQIDKDSDKAISKEEAGERWERLSQLDKNSDGKVPVRNLWRPAKAEKAATLAKVAPVSPEKEKARANPANSSSAWTRTTTELFPKRKWCHGRRSQRLRQRKGPAGRPGCHLRQNGQEWRRQTFQGRSS